MMGEVRIGVKTAGSPLATINALGPAVVTARISFSGLGEIVRRAVPARARS